MHAHAHTVWLVGEAFVVLFTVVALVSIVRDVRRAWPAIVRAMRGED